MRGIMAIVAVVALLGGLYPGLRPILHRPPLRVAVDLRPGDADDAAIAAGVERALEERDHRGGRWRVSTANQIRRSSWQFDVPDPCAHTMLYGVEAPGFLPGPEGPLLPVRPRMRSEVIEAWMRERGLRRLSRHDPFGGPSGALRAVVSDWSAVLAERPDVVWVGSYDGSASSLLYELRTAGFQGPVFLDSDWFSDRLPVAPESAYMVLAPCAAPPAAFPIRNPFAYRSYRAMLWYLDGLDARPDADPLLLARELGWQGVPPVELEDPRVYEVRYGRLLPSK